MTGLADVSIADVWQSLGGPQIKRNRTRAFWRGGGVLALCMTALGVDRGGAVRWLIDHGYVEDRQSTPEERREYARRWAAAEAQAEALATDAECYYMMLADDLERLLTVHKRIAWFGLKHESGSLAECAGEIIRKLTADLELVRSATPEALVRAYLAARAAAPAETARLTERGRSCRVWAGAVVAVLAAATERTVQ